MKLNTDQVNYVNVGLMVASCLAAFLAPFQLFLFSYAALGPLHYLTEISWLHDRRYFLRDGPRVRALVSFPAPGARMGSIIVVALVGLLLARDSPYYALIAFFLITIIHVFVFTAGFILFGALKSRSRSGMLSLGVFSVCAVSFFAYVPNALGSTVGATVRHSYQSFQTRNAELIKVFRLGAGTTVSEIYESRAGLMVMRLIAFAYTYHYLNWFSKTSIIRWHEIPATRTALIVGVWCASLALFAYKYEVGLAVLYLLSVLHVMLEFPLNHQTFVGIGNELRPRRPSLAGPSVRRHRA